MEIPSAITDARSEAARLGKVASDYASSAYTIPDQLRKTVQEALDYNKDVIGMRSTALADYMAAPANAEAKFAPAPEGQPDNLYGYFDPYRRNAAIQNEIRDKAIPFYFANTLLGMRQGTVADLVKAGTGAFNAKATAVQAASDAANKTYQDVLNEFKTVEDMKFKEKQLAEETRLKEIGYDLERQRIDISRSKAKTVKVPESLKKSVGDFNSVQSAINQFVDSAKRVKSKLGKEGTVGRGQSLITALQARIGNDPDFKNYMNLREGLASIMAKGVGKETGVLTNQDITRIQAILTDPYGTQKEMEVNLKEIRNIQKRAKINLHKQFNVNQIPYDESYINEGIPEDKDVDYEAILDALGL